MKSRIRIYYHFQLFGLIIAAVMFFYSYAYAYKQPHYIIDATLDVSKHVLQAKERVTFTNNIDREIKEVFFHIYPNRKFTDKEKDFMLRYGGYFKVNLYPEGFQSSSMTIDSIKENGKHLDFEIISEDETILRIGLPQSLSKGKSVDLDIEFSVVLPHAYGRLGWNDNVISLMRWYPILSVLDEEGWHNYPFYPYHQPFFSDSARYQVNLTIAKNYVVAHTGSVQEEFINSDETKTIKIDSQLPVRDFALAASPDFRIFSLEHNDVEIRSYYLPGDDFLGKKAAEFSLALMEYYADRFIDYPYKTFSIASTYLGYGGNQSSGIIFIDTRVNKLPKFLLRYFDFLISHETGHQWFYNLVGSDEYKEMWIDEGINSYFISEYLEDKYGPDAQVMILPKWLQPFVPNFSFKSGRIVRYFYLAKRGLDRPILGKLSSFKEPSSIFALAYGKGSIVIEMLHSLVGEEAFARIMKQYFNKYTFKNISVSDFIRICEKESGKDLDWFFDQWLNTDKTCDYAVNKVNKNKVVLENRGEIIMPVKTEIYFSDGSVLKDSWNGEGESKEIEILETSRIEKIVVDPDKAMLDLDRTNNFWPRLFETKAVPLYYAVYEIPVVLPEDSYSFIYGPEFMKNSVGMRVSLQKPYDNNLSLFTGYDLNSSVIKSVLGFEQRNLFNKQLAGGIEFFRDEDLSGKKEDLDGGKIYLRRELWPAAYGLTEVNDHITFYLLRNRKFEGSFIASGREDQEDISYSRKDEAITGIDFSLDRSGPYFDPDSGYRAKVTLEHAGHFLGGKESFSRGTVDFTGYHGFLPEQKLALHLKSGWGFPSDKNLFELGGDESLRGYGRKAMRGSRFFLGSLEYRFPLIRQTNLRLLDNIISISAFQGVAFFDAGRIWHGDVEKSNIKKDAGLGLRVHVDIGSYLEKLILRIDVAQAINEPKEDPHVWFGISHAF